MANIATVREDEHGIYVQAGGYFARPGSVNGYSHAYDMSNGGLVKGMKVKARHVAQSPLTKLTLADGTVLHWYHCGSIISGREAHQNSKELCKNCSLRYVDTPIVVCCDHPQPPERALS